MAEEKQDKDDSDFIARVVEPLVVADHMHGAFHNQHRLRSSMAQAVASTDEHKAQQQVHWTQQLKGHKALTLAHFLQPYTKEELVVLIKHFDPTKHLSFTEYLFKEEIYFKKWNTIAVRDMPQDQQKLQKTKSMVINAFERYGGFLYGTMSSTNSTKMSIDEKTGTGIVTFMDAKHALQVMHKRSEICGNFPFHNDKFTFDMAFVPNSSKLFVGGLSTMTNKNSLRRAFEDCGWDIVEVGGKFGKDQRRPYGFVNFRLRHDAQAALWSPPQVDGRHVNVSIRMG